jgi:hypothetical protein
MPASALRSASKEATVCGALAPASRLKEGLAGGLVAVLVAGAFAPFRSCGALRAIRREKILIRTVP